MNTVDLPWMPFYSRDWIGSQSVQLMSLAAQGAYIRLLCYQWEDGSVPASIPQLAKLVGCHQDQMQSLWSEMEHLFQPSQDGRLINGRLAEERHAQEAKKAAASEKSIRANEARWGSKPEEPKPEVVHLRIEDFLPDSYRTEQLSAAWTEFLQYRKERKLARYTSLGLRKLASKLVNLGHGPAEIAGLIDTAISRNWQGIPDRLPSDYKPAAKPSLADQQADLKRQLGGDL